jgi:hypothetical protein
MYQMRLALLAYATQTYIKEGRTSKMRTTELSQRRQSGPGYLYNDLAIRNDNTFIPILNPKSKYASQSNRKAGRYGCFKHHMPNDHETCMRCGFWLWD